MEDRGESAAATPPRPSPFAHLHLGWLLGGLAVILLLLPLDGPISRALIGLRLGGDLRRELESLQQYGQTLSTIVVAIAIWLQDPHHRRRLADWAAAYIAAAVVVTLTKGLVGRPRPKFNDPLYFLGPLGQYPIDRASGGEPVGVRHAWEFWSGISSDLWSMPSSHTAFAVMMAVVVGTLYPRLRPLMWSLAALVGLARVLTGAHYPSDVAAGATIGLVIAHAAIKGEWGQRVVDRWSGRASRPPE
ncbi:MAG: phosphatase PAP2 family protein [Phycisphaerales bacterium]